MFATKWLCHQFRSYRCWNFGVFQLLLILQGLKRLKRPPPSEGCPVQMVAIKKVDGDYHLQVQSVSFIAWWSLGPKRSEKVEHLLTGYIKISHQTPLKGPQVLSRTT